MTEVKSASARMLAVIGVVLLAAVLLFVIATSLGDSDSDHGGRGKGGGNAKAEKSEGKFYTVEPGDSLTSIADKTQVSVGKLTQLNPDLDPQALISGQRLKLRR
jgi:LysM repeat protein